MTSWERTGWRDQEISKRHRAWGVDCPSVDLDFLMVEYNKGLPVALVEYKHHHAKAVNLIHPTYRAIQDLAARAQLPFLVAYYWPDAWAFYVLPVCDIARAFYGQAGLDQRGGIALTEARFVRSLYGLRKLELDKRVFQNLNASMPDAASVDAISLPIRTRAA